MSFFCYFIFLFSLFQIESSNELVFVMTHFRHGARAPQKFYKGYLDYIKEKWENPGELTAVGQRMHFLLGLRNRIRYIDELNFLKESFDPHEILIYSSPFNRTLVSVSSQLQGLYPQSAKKGEVLSSEQEELSKPQVDVDCEKINNVVSSLNGSALPNSMIIAPVRMINNNERKITIYDIEGCTEKRDAIKKNNSETLDSLINLVKTFNDLYKEKLNIFYDKEEEYNLKFIEEFCDAFITDYTDRREMTELNKIGINFENVLGFCYDFERLNFKDWISGDEGHVLAHLEISKLMREFIHYMKQRVDAHINGEDLDNKFEDYSRPKMMMVSGHDSTISCYEIILMEVFGKDSDFFQYPKFASQIAFEVTADDNDKVNKTYQDYIINYYFNDKLELSVNMQEFIDKITPHIWSDKQINDFCGLDKDDEHKEDEHKEDEHKEEEKKDDNNNNQQNYNENNSSKVALIIFIILTVIFLTISVILFIQLKKAKKTKASENFNALIPKSGE